MYWIDARRLAVRARAVRDRQRRRRRQHRVLRIAAAASRRRGGARPRLVGRLRGRLSRRRRAARDQPADDPEAGARSACPTPASPYARCRWRASAVWWVVFSIPLFRQVPEPPRRRRAGRTPGRQRARRPAPRRLVETFHELRGYRQAFLLLLAFLLYNDGIQTIIRMATIYGAEIGIDDNAMIRALLVTQFIGIPFAFLFGMFAGPHRREARGLRRARGLRGHHRARLLHASPRAQFFALADARRHGAGRHAGAEPVALRQHDSAPQVVGVLRVLQRVRALCRHSRPGHLRVGRRAQRHQPQRHPVGRRRSSSSARRSSLFVDVEEGRRVIRAEGAAALPEAR